MSTTAAIAWYRGRHASGDGGDGSWPWKLTTQVVAFLTLIATLGGWLHPISPNEPGVGSSGNSGFSSQFNGARAVSFALSQIGSPYVWGATGPYKNGYDCSGLMMTAWARAGVSIPRTAYEEWAKLPHVSRADLQPGDLLFYASLGHVTMYVGHNEMIDSPQNGEHVELVSMSTPWYAHNFDGAVRP